MKDNEVKVEFSNGYFHKITILKKPFLGYKYLGLSQKTNKQEEAKNEY